MKKMLTAVLAALMALCLILPAVAEGEVTIGQALYAAHGTKCFAVLTVAMQDGVIADAYIDEFQFMTAGEAVGVPNSDADFGQSYPEGKVLASKRENAEMYSANMAAAGSTVALDVNYDAIEDYVTGKTIEELEAAVDGKTAEEVFLQDFKVFMCGDIRFGVAQGSYMTRKNLLAAEKLLKPYLEEARNKQNVEDIYMLLTDVPKEESVVICEGRYAAEVLSDGFETQPAEDGSWTLPGVVSRKKQFIPAMMSAYQEL